MCTVYIASLKFYVERMTKCGQTNNSSKKKLVWFAVQVNGGDSIKTKSLLRKFRVLIDCLQFTIWSDRSMFQSNQIKLNVNLAFSMDANCRLLCQWPHWKKKKKIWWITKTFTFIFELDYWSETMCLLWYSNCSICRIMADLMKKIISVDLDSGFETLDAQSSRHIHMAVRFNVHCHFNIWMEMNQ